MPAVLGQPRGTVLVRHGTEEILLCQHSHYVALELVASDQHCCIECSESPFPQSEPVRVCVGWVVYMCGMQLVSYSA